MIKLLIFWLLAISPAIAAPMQSVQSIQDAVGAFVMSNLDASGDYKVDPAQLDPRLQLPLCDNSLQVFLQAGELKPGRNTIGVRCNGGQNWMIYSVVTLKSYKDVVVLTKPLRRKEIIHADAVASENRELSTLPQGYLLDPADVINKQAARNLAIGSVLNKLSYQDLTLVKRGERVNILSGKAGVSISSAGTALMDGAKGEKINVKNVSSQRIIQAVVVDSGQVSVNY